MAETGPSFLNHSMVYAGILGGHLVLLIMALVKLLRYSHPK